MKSNGAETFYPQITQMTQMTQILSIK